METVINNPGLFHIVQKIIGFMDYTDEKYITSIKNLRLVCSTWKSLIESKELCKFWKNILHQKYAFNCEEDFKNWDLIGSLCDRVPVNNGRKFYQWKVSHFILLYISNIYCKQSWASVDKNIIKYSMMMKPSTMEIVLCYSSPELLDLIPEFHRKKGLLSLAMYNFCQIDMVKYLLCNNLIDTFRPSKKLILHLSWIIIKCQFNFPQDQTLIENRTQVLALFIDLYPRGIAKAISKLDCNYMKSKFERRTDMIPNGKCGNPCQLVPKELVDFIQMKNPLLMALHHDKDHQLSNMVILFAKFLTKVKYPEGIEKSVLESINFYAALRGYREIAEIVAEIVGPRIYADMSIDLMQDCLCWIDENVLKFMAFKIDQDDWQKIINSKDSSIHVAVKKCQWQFIANFAPYSTTIFEKGQNGRNALSSSLRPSFDFTQGKAVCKLLYHGMKKRGYW